MQFKSTKLPDGQHEVQAVENGAIVQVRIAKSEAAAMKALMEVVYRPDQLKFIRKAKREGFKVRFDYSGRGMFGRTCPAVVCPSGAFGFKGARTDSMGKSDIVVYLP